MSLSFSKYLQPNKTRLSSSWTLRPDGCSPKTSLLVPTFGIFGLWLGLLGAVTVSSNFWTQFFHPILFEKIFGRGRGDACTFSHMISPVPIMTTFGIQLAGSVLWRTMAFDLSLIEFFNPIFWVSLMSTQHTMFWCFFHAVCRCRARRGAFRSTVSGFLRSLFIKYTNVKNTVCLLLKFCLPGINSESVLECKLIAQPIDDCNRSNRSELKHCLVMKRITNIASWMTLISEIKKSLRRLFEAGECSVVLTLGKRLTNDLLAQYQSTFFLRWTWFLWIRWQQHVFVVLLWPLIDSQ